MATKNWIAGAIKKPGALRKELGVKGDKPIPAKKLAAAAKKPIIILDRPNPISGERVEGPTSAPSTEFISYFEMPVRHGMTMGELARLFNAERKINAELTVVPLSGWSREQWFDETGLLWINPSPNIRNLNQATLYPGIGAIEY